jgi:hypothetical protein
MSYGATAKAVGHQHYPAISLANGFVQCLDPVFAYRLLPVVLLYAGVVVVLGPLCLPVLGARVT